MFFLGRQLLLAVRLLVFVRTRVFPCLIFVGPLSGTPRPSGF